MSLLATRRSTLRVRGIARREQLLNSARALLQEREMDDISLGDVAEHAGVPKGSAYHFYADIRDLYISLLGDIQKDLQQILGSPIRQRVDTWRDVVEILIDRGVKLYRGNRAARQLQIGPKTPPELKLRDREADLTLSGIFEAQVAALFQLPPLKDRSRIFFRAVEIADLMFCLSMVETGTVTIEMGKEAKRAACAYLATYLPPRLPAAKRITAGSRGPGEKPRTGTSRRRPA
jgi:AcrR family transcriptional regulator